MAEDRPPVYEMLRQAIEELGSADTREITEWVARHYPGISPNTINTQVRVCCVNSPTRVHYTRNQRPRLATNAIDVLYLVSRGVFTRYDPTRHGLWEIRRNSSGGLTVGIASGETDGNDIDLSPVETPIDVPDIEEEQATPYGFPLESHLRDFIVRNIQTIRPGGKPLSLFRDAEGTLGREYPTDVGPIDVLAVDSDGDFVVFELKLERGPDRAMGQLMRYMGWVKQHLAGEHGVKGVVVAQNISENLRYAASISPLVQLFEYEIDFKLKLAN